MLVELRLENGEIHTRRLARSLRRCGQRNSRVLLRTNGLSEPILLYEGTILDGRNRYRACLEAAIDPIFETYSGSNPLAKVISLNLKRRHLDESQRSLVAARIATLPRGANQHASIEACSQSDAAQLLNVSRSGVQRAREVLDEGAPELIAAVERGAASVSLAEQIAQLPKDEQRRIVASCDKRTIIAACHEVRKADTERNRAAPLANCTRESDRYHNRFAVWGRFYAGKRSAGSNSGPGGNHISTAHKRLLSGVGGLCQATNSRHGGT